MTIPEEIRDRLQLVEGAEFEVEIDDDTIELHCHRSEIQRVRAERDWGAEAFPDAGEAQMDVTVPSDPVDAITGTLSDDDSDSVSLQNSIGERRRGQFDAEREQDENQP